MTVFLLLPRWVGLGHIDVIRAVGSLMTGKVENAFKPGLLVHIGSGIVFAYLYWLFLGLSGLPFNIVTGFLLGTVHGVVVMLLVCIAIMEHHPIARYHERGPMTGLAQAIAHILYGTTVGLVAQFWPR